MPVERRKQVTRVGLINGSTAGRMNPFGFGGRRQPSMGGTSRISREAYVRFCERLWVQFPGPTRRRFPVGPNRGHLTKRNIKYAKAR